MCVRTTEAKRRYRNSSQAPARPWDTLYRELVAMSETLHLQSVAGITLIRNLSLSILGFGTSKLVFGGISPFSSTIIALMIPATPLVPSRWPMFDFAAPLHAVNTRRKNEARQDIHIHWLSHGSVLAECIANGICLDGISNLSAISLMEQAQA